MNQSIALSYPRPDTARAVVLVDGIRVQINFNESPVPGTMNSIEKLLLKSVGKRDMYAENQ